MSIKEIYELKQNKIHRLGEEADEYRRKIQEFKHKLSIVEQELKKLKRDL